MRFATWNVNSIRARLPRLLPWLEQSRPDVVCLQELKCVDDQFPLEEIRAQGYHPVFFGQRTYNGVAILARTPPEAVLRGFDDGEEDGQSRLIAATVAGVRVITAYVPNGQTVDAPAYGYKLKWFDRLLAYLERHHRPEQPLLLCGDFNVAPEPEDVYDPALWEGQVLFSLPERAALRKVVGFGLVDLFRKHHPEPGRYSFWDYRQLSFPKNKGLRIDHLYATAGLAQQCSAADIDREARKGAQPSDHAPVWAELDVPL